MMRRREFLAGMTAGTALLYSPSWLVAAPPMDVEWLDEVRQPPADIPMTDRPLAPLLQDAAGHTIDSPAGWPQLRKELREAWLKFLGPMPATRPSNEMQVLKEDRPEGCIRQLVRYQSEPDEWVEGYLLRPTGMGREKTSGIVALHQTSDTSIEEIAGVNGAEAQHLGLQLCRDGHVVFCPRCFLWQTPPTYHLDVKGPTAAFHKRHPQTLGMHKMLFDAQRAVDLLVSLPDVDPQRIGAVGHSLGAKEVLYLAAFDDRVRTGVASEGGLDFKSTNWNAPWYLGTGIDQADFRLNHHQLLALIAPRPFLILAGEAGTGAADGVRSWPYVAAALPVYRLLDKSPRLGLWNHRQGHTIPPAARTRLLQWLKTYTR